jgi:hypothetical protein
MVSIGLGVAVTNENLENTSLRSNPNASINTLDTVEFIPIELDSLWNIVFDGVDTTYDGDTLQFSISIIGQDSALSS